MSDASEPTPRPVVGDAAKAVLLRARGLAQAHSDEAIDSLHVLAALAEAPAIGELLARFEVVPQQIEIRIGARRWTAAPHEDAVEERAVEDGRRIAGELRDREFASVGRTDWAAHLPDEAERRGVTGPWRFDIDLGA